MMDISIQKPDTSNKNYILHWCAPNPLPPHPPSKATIAWMVDCVYPTNTSRWLTLILSHHKQSTAFTTNIKSIQKNEEPLVAVTKYHHHPHETGYKMDITCNYEHKLKLHIAHCSIRLLSIGSHIANAKSISCPWEMQDQISQARVYYIWRWKQARTVRTSPRATRVKNRKDK